MPPRTLAIGDIHGCDFSLLALLNHVAPQADDTVILLGDIVDRGAGTKEVVEALVDLAQRCRLVFIRGNHEEMLLNAAENRATREAWLHYGGTQTLFSYGGALDLIPQSHWDFFRSSIDLHETKTHIFTHANLEAGVPLSEQGAEWLRWTHLDGEEQPWPTGQTVIVGHTPQRTGIPLVRPGWIGLDTFAWGGQWLTLLDVDSGRLVQANERRQIRESHLSEIPPAPASPDAAQPPPA
jgi:serine/threonine protein phosphatase 1